MLDISPSKARERLDDTLDSEVVAYPDWIRSNECQSSAQGRADRAARLTSIQPRGYQHPCCHVLLGLIIDPRFFFSFALPLDQDLCLPSLPNSQKKKKREQSN